ncbi:MAG: serine/threonine protein kinase [Gammaproteobacteria bacterium]|nr:serine/threonine protein kinase [Gammaproteobacteria bacterium]
MGSSIHSARSLSLENVSGTFLKVAKVPEDVFAGICVNCLADKGKNAVCPCCAYDAQTSRHHPLYLRPGTILANQYIIGKVLGQGGFGITYIGLDKWLRKKVAIKEYLPSSLAVRDTAGLTVTSLRNQKDAFAKGLHLFIDEARNLAKFDHPHIVRVINFFEENQTGYMVMEYLKGESPAAFMKKYQGRLPLDQALEILFPIFDALRTIHAKHTCHLDISAQNICIKKEDNVPVLIDFGSAKCIVGGGPHTMTLVLKPGYSPLEQYSGRGNIGPWSDIYACGALLYLMITGKFPPAATERFDTDPLVPPLAVENVKISDMANRAIMKALALKIEDRYQDIAAFQQALASGISSKEDKPANGLPSGHRTKHKKRHYFLLGTVLLIGLFITPVKEEATSPAKFVMMEPQAAAEKLTSPGEDNGTSRKILESDPADQKARQTLLAEQYAQQAMSEQEQGNLEKSLNLADKGLRIMPAHPQLLQLKAKLDYRLELQKQQEEKRRTVQKLSAMAEKRLLDHWMRVNGRQYRLQSEQPLMNGSVVSDCNRSGVWPEFEFLIVGVEKPRCE